MNFISVILIAATPVFTALLIYFILDYLGPKKILLQPDHVFNMTCLRAKDLIVQEFDDKGNLWATRGMILYQLEKGDNKFIRKAHVPSGISFFWLNNFKLFRKFTANPECIEITATGNGKICAFSSGFMWYSENNGKKFIKTFRLAHYGIGVGRGILSYGLLNASNNLLFFGEYFRNKEKTKVKIYKSIHHGKSWEIAFEFQPGVIKHIHSLQKDPYTGKLWICTGDSDSESMIGWSDNDYKNIIPIGKGSQVWRTCQLAFTKEAIYWGADTDSVNYSGIYKWDKETMELTRLQKVSGAVFFATRLAKGTVVMSTDREGYFNEEDNRTRMFVISENDKIKNIQCGTWKYTKPGLGYNYAKLRFQRNQGNETLIISCFNHKEVPNGDLLSYSEDILN